MSIRVLVVEDFQPFRDFVCSALKEKPDLQVVGEASDGLEAVQKAEALQPDLILLDIGLPTLNGIEAARQIRKLVPRSKILFVSQDSSPDVVREAVCLGAMGYVIKAHAGSDLLAAIEAVCQGRWFVSNALSGRHSAKATHAEATDLGHEKSRPMSVPVKADITSSHRVQFYRDDESFVVGMANFVEAALEAGNPVIVVATESHRKGLLQRLQARHVDMVAAIERARYIPLDVAETLATFMRNDLPDPARFLKVACDLFAVAGKAANGERPRVAACGECGLLEQGNADAAIQIERLWNEIAKTRNMDILCGYMLNCFQGEAQSQIYQRICAEHSAVCSQ